MSSDLEPVEQHLREGEKPSRDASLVIRGWPLTVDGLLRNADATRRRYSWRGDPFVAVSAEVTVGEWQVDDILSGSRLRTRRSYAVASTGELLDAGFQLLPTFGAPHYSIALVAYTEDQAKRLITALGEVNANPFFVRRSR